jgi:hypothetical protein
MKTAMACGLAFGVAAAAMGARADGLDCCKNVGSSAAAVCPAGSCKICLDANGMTAVELARQLTEKIGVEVRVQGISFEKTQLKLCAATPEEALTQIAQAFHARWHPAFVYAAAASSGKKSFAEHPVSVTFQGAPAASAAYLTAAQAGGVLITDRPLTGKVTFQGKNVPVSKVLDAIAAASGRVWEPAYVLQIGPETLVSRQTDHSRSTGPGSILHVRPGSPLTHLHRSPEGVESVAPAPGMVVADPEAEVARLEKEAMRRQQLGEWASVFTQETPKDTRRAARDLRIRVETTIQKLEAYPPQNRELGMAMWRARYERMQEDFKHLTPEQQKLVQPVLDTMKYFAAPSSP